MTTATWILIAMLTPFWWGMGLLTVALIGDLFPWSQARVSRAFNQLERTQDVNGEAAPVADRRAA